MVCNKGMGHLKRYVSQHGLTPLASALCVSVQRLANWIERGVPVDMCAAVEKGTSGEVMRWHLRPTDWHRIWPELVGSDGAPEVGETEQGVAHG